MKIIELPPLEESKIYYDFLEKRLKIFFLKEFYYPLIRELDLPKNTIENAKPNPLAKGLYDGSLIYSAGAFRGKFNAEISKELRSLGAKFDRKTSTYKIEESELPYEVRSIIQAGYLKFQESMQRLDAKLSSIIPEELADKFHCEDIFDKSLFKADKSFQKNVKNISVSPELTDAQRAKIAKDWQENTRLSIRGWTEDQIKNLRKQVYDQVISGARKDSLVPGIFKITKTIQKSHSEALNKANFLAHQETRLLMSKFKEVKYTDAGIYEYAWRCVHRPHDASPKHHTPGNVRYSHGILEGKIFRWDNPPVTTAPGQPIRKNNPGQDYRCRCFPRAILRV